MDTARVITLMAGNPKNPPIGILGRIRKTSFPTLGILSTALIGCCRLVSAQETREVTASAAPAITSAVLTNPVRTAEQNPAPIEKQEPPVEFEILTSKTSKIHVEESPPMAGLPPVKGKINVTVQLVEEPDLPEPAAPLPALPKDDPAVRARLAEALANRHVTRISYVSATVYDHNRTFFRCFLENGERTEISGWSNIDFNHFTGFTSFQTTAADGSVREYNLMMGIGNEDTVKPGQIMSKAGREYDPPAIPELPDNNSGCAYVLTGNGTDDPEAVAMIEGIHRLYQAEGDKLAAAYHERIKAENERKAELLANPPKPKDVTLRFWNRETTSAVNNTANPEEKNHAK